jgi:hypothetical protein
MSIFEIKSSVVYRKKIFSHGAKLFTRRSKIFSSDGKYDEVNCGEKTTISGRRRISGE